MDTLVRSGLVPTREQPEILLARVPEKASWPSWAGCPGNTFLGLGYSSGPGSCQVADEMILQSHFDAEQAEFVALAHALSVEQWTTPSLCEKWTIHDVITHAIWHIHRSRGEIVGFTLRSVISGPAKAEARQITRDGARSNESLIQWLAAPARCNRVNFGEMMIHQQDVRRPVGLHRTIPEDRLSWALNYCVTRAGSVNLGSGSRKLRQDLRLVATDIDWSTGQGAEVRGPGEAILMAISGRGDAVDDLVGPGAEVLAGRIAAKGHKRARP